MADENQTWVLTVGQPFAPERTQWDDGRFEYRYFSGNHLLQLCLSAPSEQDIQNFHFGKIHVGLYIEQSVIFWLFKIQNLMDWSDQAMSIRLLQPQDQDIPPLPAAGRIFLSLVLVDADTGLVAGLRTVTYSPHFSKVFRSALLRQKIAHFDKERHNTIIERVYAEFDHSRDMARAAILVEHAGAK